MKRIKHFTVFVTVFALLLFLITAVSAESTEKTITKEEAEYLLTLSATAFNQVHRQDENWWNDNEHWMGCIPEQYNTKEKMSEYFHAIYTDDIADSAWMYAFSPSYKYLLEHYPTRVEQDGKVLIYSERLDGTIDICDEISTGGGWYYGYRWIGYDYYEDNLYDCESIFEIKGGATKATAKIIVEWSQCDVVELFLTEVAFCMTENGWRICDCDYFQTLHSDDKKPGEPDYPFMQDFFENKKYWSLVDGNYKMMHDFTYTSIEQNNVKGIKQYWNVEKNCEEWYTIEAKKTNGEWNLSGGTVLDLLNGKTDVAPYTGDEANNTLLIAVAVSVVSLLGMGVALKARKA